MLIGYIDGIKTLSGVLDVPHIPEPPEPEQTDYYYGDFLTNYTVMTDEPQIGVIDALIIEDKLYTRADKIRLNGNQYIDTGYAPTNHTKIKVDFTHSISENKFLFGSRTNGSSSDAFGFLYNSGVTYAMFGSSQSSVATRVTADERHTVTLSQEGCMLDNIPIKSFSEMSFTSALPIYIGGMNQNGSISNRIFEGEIYGVRLYENNRLVRYMLPFTEHSSGAVYLYDFIGHTLYDPAVVSSP